MTDSDRQKVFSKWAKYQGMTPVEPFIDALHWVLPESTLEDYLFDVIDFFIKENAAFHAQGGVISKPCSK